MSRFRTVALLRLARFETGWLSLPSKYDPNLSAALARDLNLQKQDAGTIGLPHVVDITDRLERLFLASERQRFVVPTDIDLLVTGAIQLLGLLIRGEATPSLDVARFLGQMDGALGRLGEDRQPRSARS